MPVYTEEQQQALERRGVSIALSAGAGCGKTFVLTERYIRALDPHFTNPPLKIDQIIAITFTERAAREMRERIRSTCRQRWLEANESDAPYWQMLVREIDNARISTIHSFCKGFLQSYAIEARLDPSFRVLDAPAAQLLQTQAINMVLRKNIQQGGEDIVNVLFHKSFTSIHKILGVFLSHRFDPQAEQSGKTTPEKLVRAWQDFYETHSGGFLIETFLKNPVVQKMRDWAEKTVAKNSVMADRFSRLNDLFQQLPSSPDPISIIFEMKENAKVTGAPAKVWASAEEYERFKKDADLFRKACSSDTEGMAIQFELIDHVILCRLCLQLFRLAQEAASEYEQLKKERNALDFSDLLHGTRKLLADEKHLPLRRHFADSFQLLMVDEFQDVNALQVDLVKLLCNSDYLSGKLFFVGDFKQSIYRFQEADPQVFLELRREIPAEGVLPLSKNFRSRPELIDFFNYLFENEFPEYEELHPNRPRQGKGPLVELLLLQDEVPAKASAEWCRRFEAKGIARRISRMLANEEGDNFVSIRSRNGEEEQPRPVKKGDIVLLLRSMTNVQIYEEALRSARIDYYLVGGRAFFTMQEVKDLLNVLSCLISEQDEIALAGALRSPFFNLRDEALFWLSRHPHGLRGGIFADYPPEMDPQDRARAQFARQTLLDLRELKDRLPISEVLRQILERTAVDATSLADFLGERQLANLEKLIERSRIFEDEGFSLDDYVQYLKNAILEAIKEPPAATEMEDQDVVRIMSVHQAKGLEFPIVFVADLVRKMELLSSEAYFHPQLGPLVKDKNVTSIPNMIEKMEKKKDQEELIRLFYVACTRASDYLVLSACGNTLTGTWIECLERHFNFDPSVPNPEQEKLLHISRKLPEERTLSEGFKPSSLNTLIVETENFDDGNAAIPDSWLPIETKKFDRRQWSFSYLKGVLERQVPLIHLALPEEREMILSVEKGGKSEQKDDYDSLELGHLVHQILAQLDFNQPNISHLVDRLAPFYNLPAETIEETKSLLEQFLRTPRAKEIAAASRKEREVEFLFSWPEETLDRHTEFATDSIPGVSLESPRYFQGFIDLLYQDAEKNWHILDYKTNRVNDTNIESTAAHYEMQMYIYAWAVESIVGESPKELTLFFLRGGREFSFQWNETSRERCREMIKQAASIENETTSQF